jgi:hypothetical protein
LRALAAQPRWYLIGVATIATRADASNQPLIFVLSIFASQSAFINEKNLFAKLL